MHCHFKRPILLVVSLIIFGLLFYPLYAKEVLPVANGVNMSLSPSYTQLLIQPGKSVDITYELTNWGDPSTFSFHIYQFDTIDTGETLKKRDKNDEAIHFSSPDGEHNDQRFFLNSKKKKELKMTISVDENTVQHDYYYALTAHNEPAWNTDEKSLAARIKTGLSSMLFITVSRNGNIDSESLVDLFTLTGSSYPAFGTISIFDSFDVIRPVISLKNNGRNFISVDGELTLKTMFGLSSSLPLTSSMVLSESSRTIPLAQTNPRFNRGQIPTLLFPGKYTATVRIIIHNPHTKETLATLNSSYQFFIIPGKLIVIVVLLMLILFMYIFKKQNRIDK